MKAKLNPKKIRILELAMDVCEEIRDGESRLEDVQLAANIFSQLQDLRDSFGKSKILDDEPQ